MDQDVPSHFSLLSSLFTLEKRDRSDKSRVEIKGRCQNWITLSAAEEENTIEYLLKLSFSLFPMYLMKSELSES